MRYTVYDTGVAVMIPDEMLFADDWEDLNAHLFEIRRKVKEIRGDERKSSEDEQRS